MALTSAGAPLPPYSGESGAARRKPPQTAPCMESVQSSHFFRCPVSVEQTPFSGYNLELGFLFMKGVGTGMHSPKGSEHWGE